MSAAIQQQTTMINLVTGLIRSLIYGFVPEEMTMKKLNAASLAVMFAVTGCNTIKGFGKDVSKTGDAVTNTAQKTENKL